MDINVKKSVSWSGKLKKLQLFDDKIVDEYGETVDLIAVLKQFYSDKEFEISISAKEEQIMEYEDVLEE